MSKVIKIFFRTILWLIAGVLGLSLVAGGLLQLPSVQTWAVQRATGVLSQKLGTRVAIERVRLKFISRAELQGLYIEDFQGDTLIYAARVEAGINQVGRHTALGEVRIDGVRFRMRQVAADSSNFEQLLSRLRSGNSAKGGFRLTAHGLRIGDFHYTYRKLAPAAKQGVNFDDIDARLTRLDASAIAFGNDSLSLRIDELTLSDHSGLQIDRFGAGQIGVGLKSGYIDFQELLFLTPTSQIAMPYLRLAGSSWKDYGDFIHKVRLEGAIERSTIDPATIGLFAPALGAWEHRWQINARFEGPVADIGGEIARLRVAGTALDGVDFRLTGLPDIARARMEVEVGSLATSGEEALLLMGEITGKELPARTAAMLRQAGQIAFTGRFEGLMDDFTASGELRSEAGEADFEVALSERLTGRFEAREIGLGALLGNASLGRASLSGRVGGTIAPTLALDAEATFGQIQYQGYNYRDIELDGRVESDLFRGKISSRDRNMRFDFDGLIGFGGAVPRFDFELLLHHADLAATHINRRDSISTLACRVSAGVSGSSLDEANGRVDITEVRYYAPSDSILAERITLLAQNSPTAKRLELTSPFLTATFQSRSSYRRLPDYLRRVMQTYLPSLAGGTEVESAAETTAIAASDDYYMLRLQFGRTGRIAGVVMPGLLIAPGSDISLMLNPTAQQLSLSAQSEYIEYKRLFVSKLALSSRNRGDSLALYVNAGQLFTSGLLMPDFALQAGLRGDRIGLSAGYADSLKQLTAQLNASATLQRPADGPMQLALRVNPSYLTMPGQRWVVSSGEIMIDTTRIDLERLIVASTGGQLLASGAVARRGSDTLHVRMANFDLAPLAQMFDSKGIALAGFAAGHVDIASPIDAGRISGDILLDSLAINHVALPPLGITARWELQNQRAGMMLTDRSRADTLVRAFYSPATKRYGADVRLDGVDLSLLDPFLSGVLHGSHGSARVEVQLSNLSGALAMQGEVRIPELTTTLDFTGVPYTLRDARVAIQGTDMTLAPTRIYDPEGNSAPLEARFSLAPSGYHYTLGVKPSNLMVLNTTPNDNPLFNGRVWASGNATIRGDAHAIRMNIAATTEPRSTFAMSLSSRGNIADADFITYILPEAPRERASWYEWRQQQLIGGQNAAQSASRGASMAIDMTLAVRDNAEFSLVIDPRMGKGIRARGQGNLSLSLDPRTGELSLYGDYALTEGSYNLNLERLVDRTFTIRPGSMIRWTGDPADALLDVTASYSLKTSLGPLVGGEGPLANTTSSVDCMILLSDRLLNPTIGFDVQVPDGSIETKSVVQGALGTPEMMSTQFLWLVAFNSFYSDNTAAQIGTMSGSATVFDFLTGQLSNMLSSEKFNIGLKYRPAGDDSSDEFGVNFSWSLAENRLLLDVEGNYDTENNAAAMSNRGSNLTGDFAVRYLVDKAGNVQAKIFSRTIDTYDENQGLQESGAGIYYYEDFDRFGDIRRNMRNRFAKKKKKE